MNLHMRHLEDLAFGSPEEMEGLRKILSGFENCTTEMSEKIDGAPSFIFGADFDGTPFICYKSGLNKPFFSLQEIANSALPCKDKLLVLWPFVVDIVEMNQIWNEAWQCDLVYHDVDDLKQVAGVWCATPNLITYPFVNSTNDICIAPHTKYVFEEDGHWYQWQGSHKFDLRIPRHTRILQNIISPEVLEMKHSSLRTQAQYCLNADFPSGVWNQIKALGMEDDLEYVLNQFGNNIGGELVWHHIIDRLEDRVLTRNEREINKLKKSESIIKRTERMNRCLEFINSATFHVYAQEAVELYNRLMYLKHLILEKSHQLSTVPTVDLNHPLLKLCVLNYGEGFVLRNEDASAKIVDRPRFSRLNSDKTTKKGWHETNIQDPTPTDDNDQ